MLAWQRQFLMPNHMIELRPDGFTVLQVLPIAAGRSLLRQYHYTRCEAVRPARAAQYLASRLSPYARHSTIVIVESTQSGIVTFGHEAAGAALCALGSAAFRRQLVACVPAMGQIRPPTDH